MRTIVLIVLFFTAFVPALSEAACSVYACNNVYVDTLYTNNYSSGTVYIYTTGDEAALTGCDGSSNSLLLYITSPAGKAIYSTLLVAVTVDRQIDIVLKNNGATCEVSYVRFRRAQ